MELVINTQGATLKKVNERFQITVEGKKQEFAATKIERILITTAVLITTDAIKLAIENNIDLIFLEYNGTPIGRVWHSKLGSITTIRRKQLKLTENQQGVTIIKEIITTKLSNHIAHLQKLKLNRSEEKNKLIEKSIYKINKNIKKINELKSNSINEIRGTIEGYEGNSAKVYFETLGQLIPEKYAFNGRTRNPAEDSYNCMLNYAYGILYTKVEKACIIAGLDPYIGIMHTDNYNKTALVFDLIEVYRTYMDEIVFSLFSKRKIKKDMFDEVKGGGYWLNKSGKELLIGSINDRFENKIKYKGRQIKICNIIQYDCHNLANRILSEVA